MNRDYTYLMYTLKSGHLFDSTESLLLIIFPRGGAVILKKESNPSVSPKPAVAVSKLAAEESPQTEGICKKIDSLSRKYLYHKFFYSWKA